MANVQKSALFQKLGSRLATAHNKHKDDETTFAGGGELPAGIENGIAQLVECKFDQFKQGDLKGEYFFYAAGIVVSPVAMPDGLKVAGLRTSIMEPLCDTPNRSRATMDDHLGWIYNELRKLGVATTDIDPSNLETIAAALKEAQPHFSFRTWKGEPTKEYPNPRVNHQWGGLREFNSETDPASGVVDNTEPESKPAPTPTKQKKAPEPQPEPEPQGEFNEFAGDLDSLVAAAPNDESAVERLTEMALAAGVSQEDIDNAPDWEAVATAIREAENASPNTEETEPEPEEFKPSVGDVYKYQPTDPKTKKPMVNPKTKKAIKVEVEVTKVNEKNHTVELKNLDDGKTKYVGIGWDLLENAE